MTKNVRRNLRSCISNNAWAEVQHGGDSAPYRRFVKNLKHHQIWRWINLGADVAKQPNAENWRQLALTTLGRVSTFNKR